MAALSPTASWNQMGRFGAEMGDFGTLLEGLEDRELSYVFERSRSLSDLEAAKGAGIAKTTFYRWPEARRAELNEIAQKLKRDTVLRALLVLNQAAEKAAECIVELTDSGNPHVALRAAQDVLDRTAGRPTQRQEVSGPGGEAVATEVRLDLSGLDTDQLRALAQALED